MIERTGKNNNFEYLRIINCEMYENKKKQKNDVKKNRIILINLVRIVIRSIIID